jgi:hypothetical protein
MSNRDVDAWLDAVRVVQPVAPDESQTSESNGVPLTPVFIGAINTGVQLGLVSLVELPNETSEERRNIALEFWARAAEHPPTRERRTPMTPLVFQRGLEDAIGAAAEHDQQDKEGSLNDSFPLETIVLITVSSTTQDMLPLGGVFATFDPIEATELPPHALTALPSNLPQYTFAELKAASIAMADAPHWRRWTEIEGEEALRHGVPGSPLEVKFIAGPTARWLGLPNSRASLWEMLRSLGIRATLAYHVCIATALEQSSVTIALDQLIAAIGQSPRTRADRELMRREVWQYLAVFDAWQIMGRRKGVYRQRGTREPKDLTTFSALIRLTERGYSGQLALEPNDRPPDEVSFVAGPWLDQARGDPSILSYFGDVRRLAAIPAGKPSGAWAQAIGLTLQQRWREMAASADIGRVGEGKRITTRTQHFTRRSLLDLFPPAPTLDEALQSAHRNRHRVQEYWQEAIGILKQQGIIGFYCEVEPLGGNRYDWVKAWETQPLDIRPSDSGKLAIAQIAAQAQAAQKARARNRKSTANRVTQN